MSLSLVPARVFSSYAAVTPEYLADRGVRLLLSDLDFTLAPKSCPAPDEAVRAWIASMQRAGIEVMILSNNRSPVRIERFCKDLGIRYIGWAKKPWPPGFRRARVLTGVPAGETAMLGDKLLTDALGARRSGVLMLMVEPKGGPDGAWNHVLHALQEPFKRKSAHDARKKDGNLEK